MNEISHAPRDAADGRPIAGHEGASRVEIMGANPIGPRLRWLVWIATSVMAATVIAMLTTG
jgi:hypothetical protein